MLGDFRKLKISFDLEDFGLSYQMRKNNIYVRLPCFWRLDIFCYFLIFIPNASRASLLSANAAFHPRVSTSLRSSELTHGFPDIAGNCCANMSTYLEATRKKLGIEEIAPMMEWRDVRFRSTMQAIFFNRCRGGTETMSTLSPNGPQFAPAAQRQQHKYQRELILKLTEGLYAQAHASSRPL
jgi:hypothetical protein